MYYTFSGHVDQAYDYNAGAFVSSLGGFVAGGPSATPVTWTFLVDDSQDGYFWSAGSYNGPYGGIGYSYVEGFSGNVLPVTSADSTFYTDYRYGSTAPGVNFFQLIGSGYPGLNPNYFTVYGYQPFESLAEGQSGFYGHSYTEDRYGQGASGLWGAIYADDLELVRIASTPPDAVPEPASLVLLGSGVLWLSRLRRRK